LEICGAKPREQPPQKVKDAVSSETAVMPKGVHPTLITDLATAYWASMVLLTANRFNIFGFLSEEPLSAVELSARTTAEPRPLEMLLNAFAHGLLECSRSLSQLSRIGRFSGTGQTLLSWRRPQIQRRYVPTLGKTGRSGHRERAA